MGQYVKASIARPDGQPGRGLTPKDRLVVIDVDDIETFPARDADGVTIATDIVMKQGKTGVGIYITPGTANVSSNSSGDADAEGFTPSVQISHPGNKTEIRAFKQNWLGKNCIVILEYCDGTKDLIGSPCNPCKLAVEYSGTNEANANQLTFQQVSKGDDIAIYTGAVTTDAGAA